MKKLTYKLFSAALLIASMMSVSQVQANETMIKLLIKTQNFTDYQEELALQAVTSIKTLAEDVKSPKENVKAYLSEMMQQDQMDVEHIMTSYKAWQANVDAKLENALHAVAALHSNLSHEQRAELLATIKRMKNGE